MGSAKPEGSVRRGAWSKEEDVLLKKCVQTFGEGRWHLVPLRAGLNRCRKSCRLRWVNYLSPDIKRGYFTTDEIDLMIRLHKLLGNRWSLIANRIPGRTANDVKNYWNTRMTKKKSCIRTNKPVKKTKIIKPKAHKLGASNEHQQPLISEEPQQQTDQTTPPLSTQMDATAGDNCSDHPSRGDGLMCEFSTGFWDLLDFGCA